MNKLDSLRSKLLTALGAGYERLATADLWDAYLSGTGTVLERQVAAAAAAGVSLDAYQSGDFTTEEVLGEEIALPLSGGTGWVAAGTGASYTGGQAVFNASSSTAVVEMTSVTALNDNSTYKVVFTVTGYTQGQVRVQVYGDTIDHLGTAGPVSANGEHTFYVTTDATGSLTNRIRIQTNGPSTPGNTLNVTAISVKEVL